MRTKVFITHLQRRSFSFSGHTDVALVILCMIALQKTCRDITGHVRWTAVI